MMCLTYWNSFIFALKMNVDMERIWEIVEIGEIRVCLQIAITLRQIILGHLHERAVKMMPNAKSQENFSIFWPLHLENIWSIKGKKNKEKKLRNYLEEKSFSGEE